MLRRDGAHLSSRRREKAAADGFDPEIIDLRTLLPLDTETVLESVRKTGRVVIVHEAPKTCGFGAELAALIAEKALMSLEAPIVRVTGFDTPFPYTLENEYLPSPDRVALAIKQTAHVLTEVSHGVRVPAARHRRRRRRGRGRRVAGQGGRHGARRPADGRGDDRQGDGRDPVAARRA